MSNLFRKKAAIKAVYEDDLEGYLKSLEIYDQVMNGAYLCRFCGNKITFNNLEVLIPTADGILLVCDNKNCLNQM